ncbi:zinc-finger domain-containing protein [Neisseria perflava]|uniref:zinc-finger domain-containing protein n=1 Tax=Neisseria perflava TaxID=33053 RepID=UPI00209E0C78|nr:zinc-finger domain-containing protein [Neisseria perflava]MCP1659372.1 putative Zn-finger protein [Neisseria perflava]MCP1772184.1 putative Zn-finger protein [Neisseria perflava]
MTAVRENPVVEISPADLPLHCSGPKHETWNGHPRVFLPIQSNGDIECPYCGTYYHLNGEIPHHHY